MSVLAIFLWVFAFCAGLSLAKWVLCGVVNWLDAVFAAADRKRWNLECLNR